MKLGNAVFYTMESSKQKYHMALENWPYLGGVLAFAYFIGFAIARPMHSKLISETGLSAVLGLASSAAYPYYYHRIWMTNICTVYEDLRKAIKLNPALAKPDDDVAINKNFGPSKWNQAESGMEDDEDIDTDSKLSIFDGSAELEGVMQRKEIMDSLTA